MPEPPAAPAPLQAGPVDDEARRRSVEAVRALARAARLLERASTDLSMGQYRVLSAIAGGEQRAARVAERLALGRPTVSAAVEALRRDGLVTRTDVAHDQRAAALRCTPAGEAVLARVEGQMVALVDDLCSRTPGGEATAAVLASLGDAIDALLAERLGRGRAGHE